MSLLFIAHAGATLALAGLIWVVQIVIYPLYGSIPESGFVDYHENYTRRITRVVAPLMSIELVTAALLVARTPEFIEPPEAVAGLALAASCWISTAVIQVPLHSRLALGYESKSHRRLVMTNWLRTAAWSARACLTLVWLGRTLP